MVTAGHTAGKKAKGPTAAGGSESERARRSSGTIESKYDPTLGAYSHLVARAQILDQAQATMPNIDHDGLDLSSWMRHTMLEEGELFGG